MGIREVNGQIELLLCRSIDIGAVEIAEPSAGFGSEERRLISWEGLRSLEAGDTLLLSTFNGEAAPYVGSSFADLGLAPGSRVSVVLVDEERPARTQVTRFVLNDPLPTNEAWQPSLGSDEAGACD